MMYWLLLVLLSYSLGTITKSNNDIDAAKKDDISFTDLESLNDLANALPGSRQIAHCVLNLERNDCTVNITAYSSPCPVLKVLEHVFINIDFTKISGGFINSEESLMSIKFDFNKKGSECTANFGNVEINLNSTGKHIRVIDRTYLPLKVVLLQATWPLHVTTLRSIDLEINGVFISDNLNGFSKIPSYDGIIIEIRKPKGLTIFELKTTKSQSMQFKHLLKDFNLEMDILTIGLSLKTKSELSLKKLAFTDASLVGYIEPNIMFELQLTGHHSGSLAFTGARQVFITIQKYQLQIRPSVAVFGKFNINGKLDIEILKLASISEIPSFTFITYIKEYLLVAASEKFAVINIKQAREATDNYYCSECKARFLIGLNIVFNVPDVLRFLKETNSTKASKKTAVLRPLKTDIVHNTLKRDKIISHRKDQRRSRLEYYMRNLKRSKIAGLNSKEHKRKYRHRHSQRHKRDEMKDFWNSINTANSTGLNGVSNDTLSEFDDPFMLTDSFNPFPRSLDSNKTINKTVEKSIPSNTSLLQTNKINSLSQPNITTTNTSFPNVNQTNILSVNTTIQNLNQSNIALTNTSIHNLNQTKIPSANTSLQNPVSKTDLFNNSSVRDDSHNETVDNSPMITPTSTLSLLSSNKTVFDSFDGNSFSFHDISSLTSDRQDAKIIIPSRSKLKASLGQIIVFCNILEHDIKFFFPQPTEAELDDIKRFTLTTLEDKGECNPFNATAVKFNINSIFVNDDLLEINLNTTKSQELVPNLLSINKYMGISLAVSKDLNGKFNYENVSFSGEGKAQVVDEELSIKFMQESDTCSVIGQLHQDNIKNLTDYFKAELLSPEINKAFPNIAKISLESLMINTKLNSETTIRLSGHTRHLGKTQVDVLATVWNIIGSKKRKMALSLSSKNIALDTMLQMAYGKNLLMPPWLKMEESALIFSINGISSTTFSKQLLKDAPKQPGISFIGVLTRPTLCETYVATDRLCQYFHTKLAITSGIQVKGNITNDKLLIAGESTGYARISQEIKMVDPTVKIQYEDGHNDLYVTGSTIITMRGEQFKMQGRIFRHGSGLVVLQVATSLNDDIFNNSLVQFKPLLGIAQLSKRDDFACIIELHPSRIGIGSGNTIIHIINPSGQIIPSDPSKNYFHGVIKDLSLETIFQAIGLEASFKKIPLFKSEKFVGISKIIYSEAKKVETYDFMNEPITTGLTIHGQLLMDYNLVKTRVKLHRNDQVTLTMDWPVMNMSRGMIMIRKTKDCLSSGPTLIVTASKETLTTSMKAYVSALGMERDNIAVSIEKNNEGFVYMFNMKGKIYNEIEMFFMYRGYENSNLGFKVKGHCPNVANLKVAARSHLRKVFNDFILLYTKEKKENEKATRDVDSLIRELGTTIDMNIKGKLKDLIIQLEDVEESIKEYQAGIDIECVEKCRKPIEIQTLQELDINDIELKNLRIQKISPRWAMNVSCIAACEVEKGISHKKASEQLTMARNLFPLYEKQKQHAQKLDGFLKVAQKIKDTASKAKSFFKEHSQKAKKVIDIFMVESMQVNWFDILDISMPEVDVINLRGKLPCFRVKLKYILFRESKELFQETCINGEFLTNIGRNVFYTVFPKAEVVLLTQHFDKVKSFYARIHQRRDELVDVIHHAQNGDSDLDLTETFEELSKRDEVFKPLVKKVSKKETFYDKRFKQLIFTRIPQYSVHSYKTTFVINQKSPWAILKSKQNKRTSLARKSRSIVNNTASTTEDDCSTVNGVVGKYSHITTALVDIVEAYNNGKTTFSETRDGLIDSLHTLDAKITNEANRTYYTKGELKDMIYWSVRVWKGVEDWVQASTRQFEDHNRNAISQFTEQLNSAFSAEHASTAAGFVQKLSHIGSTAMKRMSITFPSIVKKTVAAQPDDLVQNVALALSQFLTSKDMTLDDASSKIPALRTAVHALETHVPPCDPPPPVDASIIANDAGISTGVTDTSNNAIITSNSGTISLGGAPQVISEPTSTNTAIDASLTTNDASMMAIPNDVTHTASETTTVVVK